MSSPDRIPTAPSHLSPASRAWWRQIAKAYALADHQYRTLTVAAEAFDRKEQAREALCRDGLTLAVPSGERRVHPAVAIERDARIAFLRAVRELALADGGEPAEARPPRPSGRYTGR